MRPEATLNGAVFQGGLADNALAAVVVAAVPRMRWFVTGVAADYSAPVAAIKTVTLFFGGGARMTWRWDFSKGPFKVPLPQAVHADYGQLVQATLEASGTPGVTGRCALEAFLA